AGSPGCAGTACWKADCAWAGEGTWESPADVTVSRAPRSIGSGERGAVPSQDRRVPLPAPRSRVIHGCFVAIVIALPPKGSGTEQGPKHGGVVQGRPGARSGSG